MTGRVSLTDLRQALGSNPEAFQFGLPGATVLALVDAVEAAHTYLRGTAGDPTRDTLQQALGRFTGYPVNPHDTNGGET